MTYRLWSARAFSQRLRRVFDTWVAVTGSWTQANIVLSLMGLLMIGGWSSALAGPDTLAVLPLDEGGGTMAFDMSGMDNHGTLVNGAVFEANTGDGSPFAMRFDGVDDYLDLGVIDVQGSGLTLAAWFNADSFRDALSDSRIISKASGTAADEHVFMLGTTAVGSAIRLRARVRVGAVTTTLIASRGDLLTGVWYHAAVTYDGMTLRLYLDAVEVGRTPLSGPVDVDVSLPVAVGAQPPGGGRRFFDGRLDDVRILQRAPRGCELASFAAGKGPAACPDSASTAEDTPVLIDVLANDTARHGHIDPTTVAIVDGPSRGTVGVDAVTGEITYTPELGFVTADPFTYTVADDQGQISNPGTVRVVVGVGPEIAGPAIDLWYGQQQFFGQLGRAQRWNNILGNVFDPDGVTALSVSLNGGPEQPLSIGPNRTRLQNDGDFNVEIDADDLLPGSNLVQLRAEDGLGNVRLREVEVQYTAGSIWPLPYAVNWASVSAISDVAQVIDGLWATSGQGVRTVAPGYDRLIAIGDVSWQDYEIQTTVTIHAFGPGSTPGVGLIMRWPGHNENRPHSPGDQPRVGFDELGAVTWFRFLGDALGPRLRIIDGDLQTLSEDTSGFRLQLGVTYHFRSRVETLSTGYRYTMTVWEVGQNESTGVRLQAEVPLSEPMHGSPVLLVHRLDATFGDVMITPGANSRWQWAVEAAYQADADTRRVLPAALGLSPKVLDSKSPEALTALLPTHATDETRTNGGFPDVPARDFGGGNNLTYRANNAALDANLATVRTLGDVDNNAPQIATGRIAFTKQVIHDEVDETHAVVAADLNGDGFIDVVATDFVDDTVFWYENDGSGGFVTNVLDDNLDGAYPAHVGDVDLDGDIDVLASGYEADTHVWYENDGTGGFTRRDIDTEADGAHSIVTGDMDRDGDIDLLASDQDAGRIAWYENDGTHHFTRHVIDPTADGAKRAEFADIDGDNDLDVVTASFFAEDIAWLENDGNQRFTKHIIDAEARGAYYVSPADVDGDGDIDVLAANQLDNALTWYENLGAEGFTTHLIDDSALRARTVINADIDGDGDVDALGASVNDDTIAWYVNDGNGNFTKQVIDLAANGAYGVFAIDMDHDGDVDVLSASRDDNAIALHSHIRAHVASVAISGTLVIDASLLLTVDADDGPSALMYTITDAPDFGELQVDGIPVPVGGAFTQDDIDNDRLIYMHNGLNASTDRFSFTVEDDGESGVRPAGGTFTINITGGGENLVDFEDIDLGGSAFDSSSTFTSRGFVFTSGKTIFIVGDPTQCDGDCADSGSQTLVSLDAEGTAAGGPVTMTEVSGNPFTILALNVAEGIVNNPRFPQATSITITGTRADLSTVSETLPLDGIIDGMGPAIDFQTFTTTVLATEKLISATVSATGPAPLGDGSFSIDNIAVSISDPIIPMNSQPGED